MTEDEAKTKWCPMGQATVGNSSTYNRLENGRPSDMSFCIASACMMWRKTDNEYEPQYPGDFTEESKPAGYCGLGGRNYAHN